MKKDLENHETAWKLFEATGNPVYYSLHKRLKDE